jgi:flagellar motor switch protein FliN/FliY
MEKPPESPNPEEHRPIEQKDSTEPTLPKDVGERDAASPPPPPLPAEQKNPENTTDAQDAAADGKQEASVRNDGLNLDMILDIPLEITVELGRTQMPINELLQLGPGSAVPLSKLEGEPVDIMANDRLIAKGIVLVKDEKYGIQITEITGRLKRLRGLSQ